MPRPNNRLYDLLEVSPEASARGLRASYERIRDRLASPRHASEPGSQARLADVEQAFAVLSDPPLRELYDKFGEAVLEPGFRPPAPPPPPRAAAPPRPSAPPPEPPGADDEEWEDDDWTDDGDGPAYHPGQVIEAWVSFKKACLGGTGEVMVGDDLLTVEIPEGSDEGTLLRAGGYVLELRVEPDERFTRDGLDLHTTVTIAEAEVAEGTAVVVPTLEGHLRLQVPPGIRAGQQLRAKGQGIPGPGGPGDLYATVSIAKGGRAKHSGFYRNV